MISFYSKQIDAGKDCCEGLYEFRVAHNARLGRQQNRCLHSPPTHALRQELRQASFTVSDPSQDPVHCCQIHSAEKIAIPSPVPLIGTFPNAPFR